MQDKVKELKALPSDQPEPRAEPKEEKKASVSRKSKSKKEPKQSKPKKPKQPKKSELKQEEQPPTAPADKPDNSTPDDSIADFKDDVTPEVKEEEKTVVDLK